MATQTTVGSEASAEKQTYRGNCHCGAFVYEATLPALASAHECNCSICRKKGYLWVFVGTDDDFRVVKGTDDVLRGYTFGPGAISHKFCPNCGTPVMGEHRDGVPGQQRALNARAMQGVNTWDLERKPLNGAALGSEYVPHKFEGTPPAQAEGKQLHTGSCHCGKLRVAVMSPPLDQTYDDRVAECNCSICERNGFLWIYPPRGAVVLTGDEADIGCYSLTRPFAVKTFCNTCGVNMTNELKSGLVEEDVPFEDGPMLQYLKTFHPVNLRVLDGVDIAAMKPPTRLDGALKLGPPYQNP